MPVKCILAEQGGKGGGGAGLTLIGLKVTKPPSKVRYIAGETFNREGMEVTATYGVGETVIATGKVTGYEVSPGTLTDGITQITVTYSEMGSTCTATYPIAVIHRVQTIRVSTPPTTITYKYGQTFNKAGMKITAHYSDNAEAEVEGWDYEPKTPFDNIGSIPITITYSEEGYAATPVKYNVTVNKADGSLTVTPQRVDITQSQKVITLNIERAGDGTINYTPKSINGITSIALSGTQLTITGDGKTVITNANITISVAAGTFYEAPTNVVVPVTAKYWEWGTESDVGDAAWWDGLKSWIATASSQELKKCEGRKKKVSLTSAVCGWNKASMICIGAEIDGDKTLTFQTELCSPNALNQFSNSSALWDSSNAQTECNNFATRCSASASLKQVTIKYCDTYNNNKNNLSNKTYQCKCFLPSECQMGLAGTYGTSSDEWTVDGKTQAYPYYTNNNTRIKHQDTAEGTGSNTTGNTAWYWERSRHYNYSNFVCDIYYDGSADSDGYGNTGGRLAPAFVIG